VPRCPNDVKSRSLHHHHPSRDGAVVSTFDGSPIKSLLPGSIICHVLEGAPSWPHSFTYPSNKNVCRSGSPSQHHRCARTASPCWCWVTSPPLLSVCPSPPPSVRCWHSCYTPDHCPVPKLLHTHLPPLACRRPSMPPNSTKTQADPPRAPHLRHSASHISHHNLALSDSSKFVTPPRLRSDPDNS